LRLLESSFLRKKMPYNRLSTSKIAKAVGCHPNTVRLYEQWGLIQPVPRSAKGYRLYTEAHLDQMRLARTILSGGWPGKPIRESGYAIIRRTAAGDLGGSLELAYQHQSIVQAELAQARTAVKLVERWADGIVFDPTRRLLRITDAARLLNLSPDVLRDWERNGLIEVPRDPANNYRLYSQVEIGRLRIIRMLRLAGYSLMSILRMLTQLDQGIHTGLGQVLDTPGPDEDVYTAADRWLTTLLDHHARAEEITRQIEIMIQKHQDAPFNRSTFQ
jgi:DNA-binding transcriptional MerR regulator